MSCILSGMGFVYFFGRLDPRVKQQDAPCQFPNSFFFIFLLFPFFAFEKGFCFWRRFWEKHTATKTGVMSSQEVDFVFQRACFCLVVQGKHVGGAASSSFLNHLRPPSFFRVVVLEWCCLVCSFFWWWCFLSLLWVVLLSRSPSFREVLHFPSFFCVVLLGPLEWCFLPSGSLFLSGAASMVSIEGFFIIHFSLTSVRVHYHFWKSISGKAVDQKNTKFYVLNCKF